MGKTTNIQKTTSASFAILSVMLFVFLLIMIPFVSQVAKAQFPQDDPEAGEKICEVAKGTQCPFKVCTQFLPAPKGGVVTLPEDQDLVVTVLLESDQGENVSIKPPDSQFRSTGQASQMSMLGGKINYSSAHYFSGSFESLGSHTVGSFEVVTGSGRCLTKPQAVQVIKGNGSQKTNPPKEGEEQDEDTLGLFGRNAPDQLSDVDQIFQELLRRRGLANPLRPGEQINPNDAFFINLETNKKEVFEGEQITASWYLYTRGQVQDIDTLKYPSLDGFWKEDIEVATRLNFEQEVINDVPYRRALLVSYALFPIKPGEALIDPYKAKCSVLMPFGGLGNFGFGRPYTFTKSSKPQKIKVLPLPTEGKPAQFSGGVGDFNVRASVENQDKLQAHQPFTLLVRVEGRGNAKLIELPPLNFPPELEVYDTTKETKFFKDGTSYRNFQVLLIPRKDGEITIPAITFASFNPELKIYVTQETDPIVLKIKPGEAPKSEPVIQGKLAKSPEVYVPRMELPLTSPTSVSRSTYFLWGGIYFMALLLSSAGAAYLVSARSRKRNLKDIVRRRFDKLAAKVDQKDFREVGIEATNLTSSVIGELSGLGGGSRELHQLLHIVAPSVRHVLDGKIEVLFENFQRIGFAPEEATVEFLNKKALKKELSDLKAVLDQAIDASDEARL